jgi:hypothetical protein
VAVCQDCNREMTTASSCVADALLIAGERHERRVARRGGRCGDCGVEPGGYHHLGCDLEPCPRCSRQLISCGCSWVDDDTSSLLVVADGVVVGGGLDGFVVGTERFPFREHAPMSD